MTPAEWHSTLFQCIGIVVSFLALVASIIAVHFDLQKFIRNEKTAK